MTDDNSNAKRIWVERDEIVARATQTFVQNDLAADRSLPALVDHVSALHGKPIDISATTDEDWDTLTALWVDYPDQAKIYYRSTDTELYRTHCILHELAHIALQHPGCNVLPEKKDLTGYHGAGVVRGRFLETSPQSIPDVAVSEREVMEGEAEHLAHLLSSTLFRPRFSEDEDVFG